MSPEQLDGKSLDARTDQFSFALALYEALYGRRPFSRPTLGETRSAMKKPLPPPADDCNAPGWVWPILLRALRPDRGGRFPSMVELVGDLKRGEARGAEWHLGVHALALGAMLFLHAALLAIVPIGLLAKDDGSAAGPQWVYEVVGAWLGLLLGTGWVPFGLGMTVACAYGLLRRSRWAYTATMLYAATALMSVVGAPYAVFAFWSLRRPAVRAALGRAGSGPLDGKSS